MKAEVKCNENTTIEKEESKKLVLQLNCEFSYSIYMIKRITTFILALLMLLTISNSTVFASELNCNNDVITVDNSYINTFDNDSDIDLYYINIDGISASITSSGAKVHLMTNVISKKKNNIKILMCLERLDGSTYKPIADWSKTGNGISLEIESSRVINILKKYRLRSVITVGNESVTVYRYL